MTNTQQHWFNTLNEALNSENLIDFWPCGCNVSYSETVQFAAKGKWISVYRNEQGLYERPISYATLIE